MRGIRNRNNFTPEQMEILRLNPNTASVSLNQIRYTSEFKEMFWSRYSNGIPVKRIFQDAGYDVEMLGDGRIYNFSHQLAVAKTSDKDTVNSCSDHENMADKARITAMEHEIAYLRQEIEVLKKLSLLEHQNMQRR